MCEELNLTATGTIDFAKSEILLHGITIPNSFREQIRIIAQVNVSRVYLSIIGLMNRPSRDVDSISGYISQMQSTLPKNISKLGKLSCSLKSHLIMMICPELARSREVSSTLRLRTQELKRLGNVLMLKSDLKLHTCLWWRRRVDRASAETPRYIN
jgi:hypothetical protein